MRNHLDERLRLVTARASCHAKLSLNSICRNVKVQLIFFCLPPFLAHSLIVDSSLHELFNGTRSHSSKWPFHSRLLSLIVPGTMFSGLLLKGVTALALAAVANAASSKLGSTVNVDGTFYYVPASPVSRLSVSGEQLKAAAISGEDLIPLTVVTGNFTAFDDSALKSTITTFTDEDDVFDAGFLQG